MENRHSTSRSRNMLETTAFNNSSTEENPYNSIRAGECQDEVFYETPSISARHNRPGSTNWEEALAGPQEGTNPILLSQPAQKVIGVIREIYGARQPLTRTPKHASEYYFQSSQNTPRRQLCFGNGTPSTDTAPAEVSDSLPASAPPCGIRQRLMARAQTPKGIKQTTPDPDGEQSSYFTQKDDSSSEREGTDNVPQNQKRSESTNKRGAQQSPITDYFQERKNLQKKDAKRIKIAAQEPKTQTKAKIVENVQRKTNKNRLMNVSSMNPSQRESFERNLKTAEEVACTVVYQDGSSLLRPTSRKQKPKKQADDDRTKKVDAMVIALPWSDTEKTASDIDNTKCSSRLVFVSIPLNAKDTALAKWCRETIQRMMESPTRIICYDAQKTVRSLLETIHCGTENVCLKWRLLDPKVAAWLLNPDHPPQSFAEVLTSFQFHLPEEDEECNTIVCQDIAMLGPLMVKLYSRLKSLSLWNLFIALETPLCSMLAVMETQAIGINPQVLIDASNILKMKIHQVEAESHKAAGHPFLINSPQQLREVLFEELRLDQKCKKKLARTSINNYKSTSEAVLLHLQEFHPLPKLVLQYRHLVKLKSTYFDGILSHVKEGVLLTRWEQTTAASGRLASANPNLQAIPKQSIQVTGIKKQLIVGKPEEVITIHARDAYQSRKDWLLLAADFQSIELRLLSHLSEDPSLLQIFNDQACADVFTTLTSQWLGKMPEEIQFQERERTKRIVYSVIYGVGSEKLGHTLKVSGEEAKGFMESFLGRFPGIKEFTRRSIEQCQRNGYVSTILHRRRWLPNIKAQDFGQRSQAERQAVNFIVQGSAADICKAAMIQLMSAICEDSSIHARLLLQIHDELLLEVPESEIKRVTAIVKSIMESTERLCGGNVQLKVPLPVSISTGRTWGHMEAFTDFDTS